MRKRLLITAAAVLPLLAMAGYATAGGGQSALTDVRDATAAYHSLDAARQAGYVLELKTTTGVACIADANAGGMGVHMVDNRPNGRLDSTIEATQPEALVYELRNDGSFKLVAVEYVVDKATWDASHSGRPVLFGQEFDEITVNPFGLDPFYALHAWIWKPNPSGILKPWNPRVSCP
jgi:hypothetical protein